MDELETFGKLLIDYAVFIRIFMLVAIIIAILAVWLKKNWLGIISMIFAMIAMLLAIAYISKEFFELWNIYYFVIGFLPVCILAGGLQSKEK